VPGLPEERHDTMPVPCNTAGTRNESEGHHALLLAHLKVGMNQ
jgi:hypothetical protein